MRVAVVLMDILVLWRLDLFAHLPTGEVLLLLVAHGCLRGLLLLLELWLAP